MPKQIGARAFIVGSRSYGAPPPAQVVGSIDGGSSSTGPTINTAAVVGGALIGWVVCYQGCWMAPILGAVVAGAGVSLMGSSGSRIATDVLYGGVLGAGAKLAGFRPTQQQIALLGGVAVAEFMRTNTD